LLATHLLRTTHHPIVICGAEGIGKSACLNHLLGQTKEDLRFCRLDASEPDSQLHQCLYRALGLNHEPTDTEEARIKYLEQRLSQLRQLNQVPVLVVDDIDQCSTKNQQQIETCLNWRDEQGQPLLQMIATAKRLPDWLREDAQSLTLTGLLEQELPFYLEHRMRAVAYQGESLFPGKKLQKFFRQSQGNPAQLNYLAHQALLTQKHFSSPIWMQILTKKYKQFLTIALFILVVTVILMYQDRINAWFTLTPTVEAQKKEEIVLPVLDDDEVTAVVLEEETNTQAIAELEALLASMPEYAAGTEEEEVERLDISIEPVEAVEDVIKPIVHDVDWIMAQETSFYTFQLMGSWDEQEVNEFIKTHALSGKVARFTSTRQGQPWYVLIYGLYPNKEAALKASEAWSAELAALPTWLRRMDSVQKQVKAQTVLSE
jgi:DamX protein